MHTGFWTLMPTFIYLSGCVQWGKEYDNLSPEGAQENRREVMRGMTRSAARSDTEGSDE